MDNARFSIYSDLSLQSTLLSSQLSALGEGFNKDETSSSTCSMKENTNPLEWVTYNEAYCFDLERFTKKYVDALTKVAVDHLYPKQGLLKAEDVVKPIVDEMTELPDSGSELVIVPPTHKKSELWTWPKISEFNIKFGLEKVQEYVSAWKRSEGWLFSVEFLGWETEDCSNIFVYEVEWSKPTPAYPIPQATASVYFALEVFKMVPYCFDRQVGVTYVFEMSNVIHVPGNIDFQEKWLQDIINAKLKFFKSVAFLVSVSLFTGKSMNCEGDKIPTGFVSFFVGLRFINRLFSLNYLTRTKPNITEDTKINCFQLVC